MTIRHLKVFIKVCEFNSISKAAEELCIAQPSVSQTIKELEHYYDVNLFNRINKKLVLTKEGEILLAKAKDVIFEFDDFESLAGKKDLNPSIKVGATMSFGEFVLPNFVKQLKRELPEVDPYIYIDKAKGLEEKVLLGDLDFAIVEGLITNKTLKETQVGEDRLVLVTSPTFDIPNKITIKDLIKYDLLLREVGSPSRRIFDYQLAIKGIKITKPRLESISNNVVISMAISGAGIGILPYALAKRYLNEGLLKEITLDVSLNRKLFIITLKNKKFNQVCKKAYNICVNLLRTSVNN